jgi:hypothetical protein
MTFLLLNKTTNKFVMNDDHTTWATAETHVEALTMLARVNDLKKLNPDHANDRIIVWPERGGMPKDRTFDEWRELYGHDAACEIYDRQFIITQMLEQIESMI